MNKLNEVRSQVCGILELVACGGAHEIERNEDLASFDAEITKQEDGSLILITDNGTQRFRVTIELID